MSESLTWIWTIIGPFWTIWVSWQCPFSSAFLPAYSSDVITSLTSSRVASIRAWAASTLPYKAATWRAASPTAPRETVINENHLSAESPPFSCFHSPLASLFSATATTLCPLSKHADPRCFVLKSISVKASTRRGTMSLISTTGFTSKKFLNSLHIIILRGLEQGRFPDPGKIKIAHS